MSNKYVYIVTEHFYDDNDEEVGESLLGVASSLDKANFIRSTGCHSNINNITVDSYIVDDGVPENYSELTLYPIYKIVFDKTLRFCNSIKVIGYARYPDDFSYYPRWDITEHFFNVFIIGKNETEKRVVGSALDYLSFNIFNIGKNETEKQAIESALDYLKQQLELAIKNGEAVKSEDEC